MILNPERICPVGTKKKAKQTCHRRWQSCHEFSLRISLCLSHGCSMPAHRN
jgi:hypothetical protein